MLSSPRRWHTVGTGPAMTPRMADVDRLWRQGLSRGEIARTLGISRTRVAQLEARIEAQTMVTLCIDCRVQIKRGRRCWPCQAARDRRHNGAPQRAAYRDPAYRSVLLEGRCEQCGATRDLTRDHIVPLIRGGTNERSNLRILCRSCNSARRASKSSRSQRPAYPGPPRREKNA